MDIDIFVRTHFLQYCICIIRVLYIRTYENARREFIAQSRWNFNLNRFVRFTSVVYYVSTRIKRSVVDYILHFSTFIARINKKLFSVRARISLKIALYISFSIYYRTT